MENRGRAGNRCARLAPLLFLSLAGQALFSSDTVLVNGHIYTANTQNRWVEALAITGDKIDAVGSNAEIAHHRAANTKVVDLQGKTVIPGITDGHVHLWFGALALHGFNLSTPESNITSKAPDLLLGKILHRNRVHRSVDLFDPELDLRNHKLFAFLNDNDVVDLPGRKAGRVHREGVPSRRYRSKGKRPKRVG